MNKVCPTVTAYHDFCATCVRHAPPAPRETVQLSQPRIGVREPEPSVDGVPRASGAGQRLN